MEKEQGVWRTINGTRVFIRDGESAKEALNRVIAKHNEDKKAADIAKNKAVADKLNGKQSDYVKVLEDAETRIQSQAYESAILIDKNGNVLFDKDGATDHVAFSADELAKMKGAILTHNHPLGTCFSWQDLQVIDKNELAEIRAVGRNGSRYTLTKIDNRDTKGCDFAWAYYQACQAIKGRVDEFFYSSSQDQAACDKANGMVESARRKWLHTNSEKYGYRYTDKVKE